MSTWQPRPAPYSSHCAACGAHWRMHQVDGNTCPQAYRPDQLQEARQQLWQAIQSGDQGRIFVARGEVQRLGGDPDATVVVVVDQAEWANPDEAAAMPPRQVAYTNVTADDWVVADPPRQVRCRRCGGALVTIDKARTCEDCGLDPAAP